VAIVAHVVAEILHRRRIERRDPQRVHAEPDEIFEAAAYPFEITDAVAVGVEEAARIDLVEHRRLPPRCARRRIARAPGFAAFQSFLHFRRLGHHRGYRRITRAASPVRIGGAPVSWNLGDLAGWVRTRSGLGSRPHETVDTARYCTGTSRWLRALDHEPQARKLRAEGGAGEPALPAGQPVRESRRSAACGRAGSRRSGQCVGSYGR